MVQAIPGIVIHPHPRDTGLSDLVRKALSCLDASSRGRLWALAALMLATAIMEVAGVGSIVPFLTALSNPALFDTSPALQLFQRLTGESDRATLTWLLGVLALAALVIVNLLGLALAWMSQRFTWVESGRISARLFEGHLAEPYAAFGQRHSAGRINLLLIESTRVAGNVFVPLLMVAAKALSALLIMALLVMIDPVIALVAAAVFGGVYGLLLAALKRRSAAWSREAVRRRDDAAKTAGEAYSNFKAIRLTQDEPRWLARFHASALRAGVLEARNQFLAAAPRYILEIAAFGALFGVVIARLGQGQGIAELLPAIGAFAFAGTRLLPALQQIYAALAAIRVGRPSLDIVAAELQRGARLDLTRPPAWSGPGALVLQNVSYRYPGAEADALSGVSLAIAPGAAIAVTGRTGAGKSTLVDLAAGLLAPSEGKVIADGQTLEGGAARSWQSAIGYVAQETVLLDDTFAANITFGTAGPPDPGRMREAARQARIAEAIETEYAQGYGARAGERGGALSGGQRQRIGIARALYRQPKLLILDEPTSALDAATEAEIVDTLKALKGQLTLLIITHRPALLAVCDRIVAVDQGRLSEAPPPGAL